MAILVDHATLQSVHVLALAEAMRKVNDALRVVKRIGDLLEAYEQEARV